MLFDRFEIINEEFYAGRVPGEDYDELLAHAWRHFGTHFFRYNYGIYSGEVRHVWPLRIRVRDFTITKSQRRVLSRNTDLDISVAPTRITGEIDELFHRHKTRFTSGTPNSIYDFISPRPADIPVPGLCVTVRQNERLIAASFFDVGRTAISSIYGIFDPEIRHRSLGILTMLIELEYARDNDFELYYHGYAYEGESFYDYKKRFSALERYDWAGNWTPTPGARAPSPATPAPPA
jgi:arginine-tRNA-protein transferase